MDQEIQIGDVVQITPDQDKAGFSPACFMIVTEVKSWGVQGYIQGVKQSKDEKPNLYYFTLLL